MSSRGKVRSMNNKHHPYHPIVYVRGFAVSQTEIEETVADPYMGFNLGSTKTRQVWDGRMRKFFFESPLVRLKDEIVWITTPDGIQRSSRRYDDVYVDGDDLTAPDPEDPTKPMRPDIALPYQSLVIFRYYDEASESFGTGETPPIEHFAQGLNNLILRLKALVCRQGKDPITGDPLDNEVAPEDFRVYLVAHSMGGLVCRAFLQNPGIGSAEARRAVDKLFTYATPHNGIDLRIVRNVPGWATFGDANNFNRQRMAGYLSRFRTTPRPPRTISTSPSSLISLPSASSTSSAATRPITSSRTASRRGRRERTATASCASRTRRRTAPTPRGGTSAHPGRSPTGATRGTTES